MSLSQVLFNALGEGRDGGNNKEEDIYTSEYYTFSVLFFILGKKKNLSLNVLEYVFLFHYLKKII